MKNNTEKEYVCPKCEFRFKDIDAGSDLGCPVDWCPRHGEPCDVVEPKKISGGTTTAHRIKMQSAKNPDFNADRVSGEELFNEDNYILRRDGKFLEFTEDEVRELASQLPDTKPTVKEILSRNDAPEPIEPLDWELTPVSWKLMGHKLNEMAAAINYLLTEQHE